MRELRFASILAMFILTGGVWAPPASAAPKGPEDCPPNQIFVGPNPVAKVSVQGECKTGKCEEQGLVDGQECKQGTKPRGPNKALQNLQGIKVESDLQPNIPLESCLNAGQINEKNRILCCNDKNFGNLSNSKYQIEDVGEMFEINSGNSGGMQCSNGGSKYCEGGKWTAECSLVTPEQSKAIDKKINKDVKNITDNLESAKKKCMTEYGQLVCCELNIEELKALSDTGEKPIKYTLGETYAPHSDNCPGTDETWTKECLNLGWSACAAPKEEQAAPQIAGISDEVKIEINNFKKDTDPLIAKIEKAKTPEEIAQFASEYNEKVEEFINLMGIRHEIPMEFIRKERAEKIEKLKGMTNPA